MSDQKVIIKEVEKITLSEFLERTPPGQTVQIANLFKRKADGVLSNEGAAILSCTDIQLHCESEHCNGTRFFAYQNEDKSFTFGKFALNLKFLCRNCNASTKLFSVMMTRGSLASLDGSAFKIGEHPTFGPPLPSRVVSLIGPDRELFIKGRRAENQGLGLGAFAYYRRVVENQKGRLITEIAKVASRVGASPEDLKKFEYAAKETQFSKAIDDVKAVIPQSLLINGHNPLTLLHSALSEGIHAGTDEECLGIATSIRVVLTELAERINQLLKDEAELKDALSRLLRPNNKTS